MNGGCIPKGSIREVQVSDSKKERKMVAEILFLATLLITRVVFPVAALLALGALIERKLNRDNQIA